MADQVDPKRNENEEVGRGADDVRDRLEDDEEFEDIDEDDSDDEDADDADMES
jgi:hypothetical protein